MWDCFEAGCMCVHIRLTHARTDVDKLAPHDAAGGQLDVAHRLVDHHGALAPQLEDAGRQVLRRGLGDWR